MQNWAAAGLKSPCLVRLKLFTLDTLLIIEPVGALIDDDRRNVQAMMARSLALN